MISVATRAQLGGAALGALALAMPVTIRSSAASAGLALSPSAAASVAATQAGSGASVLDVRGLGSGQAHLVISAASSASLSVAGWVNPLARPPIPATFEIAHPARALRLAPEQARFRLPADDDFTLPAGERRWRLPPEDTDL